MKHITRTQWGYWVRIMRGGKIVVSKHFTEEPKAIKYRDKMLKQFPSKRPPTPMKGKAISFLKSNNTSGVSGVSHKPHRTQRDWGVWSVRWMSTRGQERVTNWRSFTYHNEDEKKALFEKAVRLRRKMVRLHSNEVLRGKKKKVRQTG